MIVISIIFDYFKFLQFRAAWLRIFKKQDKNASFNENLAETTCNQLSITSSRISIECTSFTKFEKRRKKLKVHLQHEKKLKKMMAIEQLNEKITITSEKKSKNNNAEPKNDYELSIIQSGKHSLIRKDSYQSNVC